MQESGRVLSEIRIESLVGNGYIFKDFFFNVESVCFNCKSSPGRCDAL